MAANPKPQNTPAAVPEPILQPKRGQLTVFFGMAPGVGKTYAMMLAAREEKLAGRHVVIGCVEPHESKTVREFAKGLIDLPSRELHRGVAPSTHINFDALLAIQPHVVILDDLSRVIAADSRHEGNSQNIRRLLDEGIDIFTTLSLQNLASQVEAVQDLTGMVFNDVVPDSFLADATIKLIDLPPAKLRERLSQGMAYLTQDPDLAEHQFFSERNLALMRELAWRWASERIAGEAHKSQRQSHLNKPRPTDQLLSAKVTARPDSERRNSVHESETVKVEAVRDADANRAPAFHRPHRFEESTWLQYLIAVSVVSLITVAAMLLGSRLGPPHAAALIYLLGVVALGSFVERGPTMLAALLSALLWNYFILPPIFEFRLTHFEDGLPFGMYFVVALIMGQLTTRIRAQQQIERLGEERATALFLLTRDLSEASNIDEVVRRAVLQMEKALGAQATVFLYDSTSEKNLKRHGASAFTPGDEGERAINWVIENGKHAGRFADNLPLADALYAPLLAAEGMVGVIGLRFPQAFSPTIHHFSLIDAFLEQFVLALDRKRLHEVSEKAKVLAESERLSKTLLDSMSHEVRTPIAVIMGATSMLAESQMSNDLSLQKEMVGEIQEATTRLNRLVGNFLEASHLESGAFKPHMNDCEVSDLIYTVLTEMEKELACHRVNPVVPQELPLVWMDFVLTQQALTNILSNATFHTPPGTKIDVIAEVNQDNLNIIVADGGPGIPPASLSRLFDKFYRAPNAPAGGTGLGLSIVKGFMEAQGGTARAENRPEGGAKFTLQLPLRRKTVATVTNYE